MKLRHSDEWVTLYLYTLRCRSQISHQSSAQIFVDRELFTKDALKIFVDSNVGHVQTIMSKFLLLQIYVEKTSRISLTDHLLKPGHLFLLPSQSGPHLCRFSKTLIKVKITAVEISVSEVPLFCKLL